jgi:asparagine synthase (glutamine-hydrolysing)
VGGGIDSSAVLAAALAAARGAKPREVTALALDFDGPGSDRPHRAALAESLGIVPVTITPADCVVAAAPRVAIDGGPFPWAMTDIEIRIMETACALGADIVLSGALGDDVFGGDIRVFAALARQGRALTALRGAATLRAAWADTMRERVSTFLVRPLVSSFIPKQLRPLLRYRRQGLPAWAGPLLVDVHRHRGEPFYRDTVDEILGGRARLRIFDDRSYNVDVADYRGQIEVASGCGRRDPLLDEEIVDFVGSLPAPLLFHGGYHRGLLRLAMRGLIPDSVRLRCDKASFTPAIQAIFRAPGRAEAVEPLASMTTLGELGLVEPEPFARAFAASAKRLDGAGWMEFWPALAVEGFARSFQSAPLSARKNTSADQEIGWS